MLTSNNQDLVMRESQVKKIHKHIPRGQPLAPSTRAHRPRQQQGFWVAKIKSEKIPTTKRRYVILMLLNTINWLQKIMRLFVCISSLLLLLFIYLGVGLSKLAKAPGPLRYR